MEGRDSSEYGTGSTGSSTGSGSRKTGSGTGSGTGNSTESGSRNTWNGTGNNTGTSTGSGSRNVESSTGNGTGSGPRNTGSGTGNSTGSSTRSCTGSTGSSTGSGSRNVGNNTGNDTGNGTGNGTGNDTGNGTGNGTGSGRVAPPGGPGRALLCLALLLLLPPARALPTPVRALPALPRHSHPLAQCLNRSWDLLEAANSSLHLLKERDILRFNCTFEEVDLEDITENQINTITACTAEDPGPRNCPVLERSTFDEGKCLQGISEDLRAYRPHLSNLEDPQLLVALDALMEALGNCSGKDPEAALGSPGWSPGSSPASSPGSAPGSAPGLGWTPFPERMRLCSALLAFRVRSVTISRMLNFLSSL